MEKAAPPSSAPGAGLRYVQYQPAQEPAYLPRIRDLISHDLSEPYSIYVYRYFLYQWSDLCFMVRRVLPFLRTCIRAVLIVGRRGTAGTGAGRCR